MSCDLELPVRMFAEFRRFGTDDAVLLSGDVVSVGCFDAEESLFPQLKYERLWRRTVACDDVVTVHTPVLAIGTW